ncbi:MAG TPA: DUF971 domain-containing protein [Bacteroidota bacterium]|nr:DUF971 domain-containing protein [Bacteroidota bacterium]
MPTIPKEIKLLENRDLRILWSDGHIVHIPLQFLRDECPCAGCKGETDIFGEIRMPMQLPIAIPGKYELKRLAPMGNYAIVASWGDGHDTGIYSWEYLLELERRLDPASDIHPDPEQHA